jgi:hypothetical protein
MVFYAYLPVGAGVPPPGRLPGQAIGNTGHFSPDDLDLFFHGGKIKVEVEAATFQTVREFALVIAGKTTTGMFLAGMVPSSGNRNLEVGKHFKKERFKLRIALVDLVD